MPAPLHPDSPTGIRYAASCVVREKGTRQARQHGLSPIPVRFLVPLAHSRTLTDHAAPWLVVGASETSRHLPSAGLSRAVVGWMLSWLGVSLISKPVPELLRFNVS